MNIRSLMDELSIVGASFAVIRDGQLVDVGAEGFSNADANVRVTRSTQFEAASLSKPVFSYLILKMVELGLLSLDNPLEIMDLDGELEDRGVVITARHILSHTSGLPNWRSAARPLKVYFSPGTRFSYSGEGYLWLQRSVERITGKSLENLARSLVFEPLAMSHSSFDGQCLSMDHMARPHDAAGGTMPKVNPPAVAASSLHTTSEDYARFLLAVLFGTGLSLPIAAEWLRPVRPVARHFFSALDPIGEPEPDESVSWGLGWGLEGHGGFFHWGSNPGFKSFALGSVSARSAIVVLSTGTTELAFGPQLAQAMIPGAHPSLEWFARG
jgi:CubicO group peptidase (beta-lactamase class C family)